MYELFTLGGGVYLVDLLNAVAAITGGGAYLTLAQLAGVAGLAWILFRTAFGGFLEGQRQVGADVHRRVGAR